MQSMSWTVARLGSRFSLTFEPHRRRVMHSALGRFLDQPLDLAVGLVEPDGTERTLPFTRCGRTLYAPEQFERMNSITYRGHSERYRLRFEFNIHSVFYPQDEPLCLIPAFYLEMRVNPAKAVRWIKPAGPAPQQVKLFIRLQRPDTQITATSDSGGRIDLAYQNPLKPVVEQAELFDPPTSDGRSVAVHERIVSLTPGAQADPDGNGLTLVLPVTEVGSGIKWRLVWAAHCGEPILQFCEDHQQLPAKLRYTTYWPNLDAVVEQAVDRRDDWLIHSRNFEKLCDQASLRPAQRHLVHQGFQTFLGSTFWSQLPNDQERFTVWEGSCLFHATLDVEYNVALVYLCLWPKLLSMQFDQWARHLTEHPESQGAYLDHDIGYGLTIDGQGYPHPMPVEENCNFLLLMQVYARWTGDLGPVQQHGDLLARLTRYLLWSDQDGTGFPDEGTASAIDDAGPAAQFARKQTYLAAKRIAALRAASDLLGRVGCDDLAQQCDTVAAQAAEQVEQHAWLGDHYAVCLDRSTQGLQDVWTKQPLPYEQVPGWDSYSIYTANGFLLPLLVNQSPMLDQQRLLHDLRNAMRETLGPYGCSHTSVDLDNVWASQNLWRDFIAGYMGMTLPDLAACYWDMQVASNTGDQSLGFVDTYIGNNLSFHPRGVTSIGYLLTYPRLVIDRLAAGGPRITVEPDRHRPQRWPLLPLADWKAGKIPVCVVDAAGNVSIENEMDPVIVRGAGSSVDVIG